VKTQLVVIQPTSFCNINCRYCYLPDRALPRRISLETLSQIFCAFFSSSFVSDHVVFVWHAGEPLVLPIGFYQRAFELQQHWNSNGVQVTNSFQTNATLITQKWCQFFKAYDVHIGVSLDGPRYMHDAHRVDRAGRGTFDRVLRGIELLQENDISYSVIAVVTKDSIEHPDDFWQFFADLHPASLGLNPEETEGINEDASLKTEEDIDRYRQFFRRLLILNGESQTPLSIREIDNSMRHIRSASPQILSHTNVPMAILSFDCNGNASTFSPELLTMSHHAYDTFIFGNVFEGTLEDIYNHPKFIAVDAEIQQGVARCRETCEYFAFCGGGSPSNKLYENGTFDSTETVACRLRVKATMDMLLEYLEEKYYIAPSSPENPVPGEEGPVITKNAPR
jgi:uncharacterized protein